MIDSQLKPCGIVTPRVVAAFFNVPREDYVDPARRGLAYVDAPQAIAPGRELLSPLSLGTLVEDAAPASDERVLVIGTGTGYSAAILAELAGHVTALESDAVLAARARGLLAGKSNIEVVEGPLEAGWAGAAPYTLILIDGAIQLVPDDLVAQLAEGGRLFAIFIGSDGVARAARGRKQAGLLRLEPFAEAAGALLPSFRKAPAFQF
jgi:protein-L-isoaspartate(D-aspartate) O-methyltransferase